MENIIITPGELTGIAALIHSICDQLEANEKAVSELIKVN